MNPLPSFDPGVGNQAFVSSSFSPLVMHGFQHISSPILATIHTFYNMGSHGPIIIFIPNSLP